MFPFSDTSTAIFTGSRFCCLLQVKEETCASISKKADLYGWTILGCMGVQFGILARLTWWEYSWDIMEPVTYFVTYATAIAACAYYVLTKQVRSIFIV